MKLHIVTQTIITAVFGSGPNKTALGKAFSGYINLQEGSEITPFDRGDELNVGLAAHVTNCRLGTAKGENTLFIYAKCPNDLPEDLLGDAEMAIATQNGWSLPTTKRTQ